MGLLRKLHLRLLLSCISGLALVSIVIMYVHISNQWNPHVQQFHVHRDPEPDLPYRRVKDDHEEGENHIADHHDHNNFNQHSHVISTTVKSAVHQDIGSVTSEQTIAVGLGITTRGLEGLGSENLEVKLPFFRGLMASFCRTCSLDYEYHFYLAHDHNDPFFHANNSHKVFESVFYGFNLKFCPHNVNITLHLVECHHTGHPTWAQNDAMMEAYMDNMAYYYRINDDTIMETAGWTERFIDQLLRFNPPNVGVVGPWFRDGNIAILTHDFVHRTHIDIFGFYYPRVFTDWFADDWITGVYWPERCRKVHGTRIKHTMEMGSRYVAHYEKANQVAMEVEIGKITLNRWIESGGKAWTGEWPKDANNVVSMALYGDWDDFTFGAIRYAQLVLIMMKGWRVRVYLEDPKQSRTVYGRVSYMVVRKLQTMGVEVIHVDYETAEVLEPPMWALLVADDTNVERFIVREINTRPSEREAKALKEWSKTDVAFHCIRDHPKHATSPIVSSLIGGIPSKLRDLLGQSWRSLMRGYTSDKHFVLEVIWPRVKDHCICHDSVSCKTWPNSRPFPMLRADNEYVGQPYDVDDQPRAVTDSRSWNQSFNSPDCVFVKNTGFKEDALKAVIRTRPVLWSQDYHVTPIMDIKSLLKPIGVKIFDKSLSYYCGQVGTCAKGLKIITKENGMRLTPELIEQFYQVYKDDPDMQTVTAFVCTLPVAMCEAFLKFNKSIIVIATIRYEQGRNEPVKWRELNQNLIKISQNPHNVIAANNMYDQRYIEYFTGLKPLLVPNSCQYLRDSYKPNRKEFLVTPIHSTPLHEKFFIEFDEALMKAKKEVTIFPLRTLYTQYLFSDLASHPGIIYIPYQVSMVSLTEQYRMNIPLFFPTLDLLTKWHLEFQCVRQRTWAGYMRKKESSSDITGVLNAPDPNNDIDEDPVKYWLKFADFYQWPHLIYYNSISDLVSKLVQTDLNEVSLKMKEHNQRVHAEIKEKWSDIMLKVINGGR